MNFEEAARQHKRIERTQSVLALRDDLPTPIIAAGRSIVAAIDGLTICRASTTLA